MQLAYSYIPNTWNDLNEKGKNYTWQADVTLATADDKQIRAHQIILCSNSAFDCYQCDYIAT